MKVESELKLRRKDKDDASKKITLRHPKLLDSLYMTMLIYGAMGPFRLNASQERNIKKLKLKLQQGDKVYTNLRTIFIGENFKYFNGDINHDFSLAKILIGHEIGHVRFTNKFDYMGAIYSSSHKYGPYVTPLFSDLMAILEDSRIEYLMGKLSNKLGRGFFYLNNLIAKDIENEGVFEKKLISDKERLQLFPSLVLYAAITKRLPKIKDIGLRLLMKRSYKYILFAQRAATTKEVVLVVNKLMLLSKSLIRNVEEKLDSIMKTRHEVGVSNPIEGEELSSIIPIGGIFTTEEIEKIKEELSGFAPEKDLGEYKENQKDEVAPPNTFEHLDEENLNEENDALEERVKNEDGLTEEDYQNIKNEMFEPITEALIYDYFSNENKTSREKRDLNIEKEIRENIKPVFSNPELHAECVPYFVDKKDLMFFEPHEYEAIKNRFRKIIDDGAKNIKRIREQYELTSLSLQRRGALNKRRLINAAAFGETNIFDRKQREVKNMEMDVMILVDVSGSNAAAVPNQKNHVVLPRFKLNQMATLVAHEIMKKAKIKHTVWAFDEAYLPNSEGKLIERFIPVIDYHNSLSKNSGLAIASIQALNNNRDGYSIAYAGEFFNKISKSEKKLLIIISDGAPHALNYTGQTAVHDTASSIIELENKGIKVFGIFTGSEYENKHFENMYKNAIFFNNEFAHELPDHLKSLIVREFKDMLI